jgi:hypothetical protein
LLAGLEVAGAEAAVVVVVVVDVVVIVDTPFGNVCVAGVEFRRDEKNPTLETLRRTPKVLAE